MKRKILLITGSRGEWGYLRPIIRFIEKSKGLSYYFVATNMHLLPEYGYSLNEIKKDGVRVDEELYAALAGSTHASMIKTLATVLMSITDTLHRERPDIVLLAGDRGEQLMTAIAASHFNIPVAHIQAGEVSGNIDGLTRHALARFVHIHFAANDDAAQRLIRSGEQEFRVHNVGAPQLDDFVNGDVADENAVYDYFRIDRDKRTALLVQHPVTEQAHLSGDQIERTVCALSKFDLQVVVIYPNNDAGSEILKHRLLNHGNSNFHIFRNVPRSLYAGLMKISDLMVGNSSSGLLEAPTFALPAVNIGRRQAGRFRGANVIDAGEEEKDIIKGIEAALNPALKKRLGGMKNPYGDGKSSERIVDILASIPINEKLLFKRMTF